MKLIPEVERFRPLYVVLGRAPGDNAWQGRVENSFSMDWSKDRVRVWWSGKAYSILGEHKINGEDDAKGNAPTPAGWEVQVFNLEDENCPVEIDQEQWLKDMAEGARRKYENRNPMFKLVETV